MHDDKFDDEVFDDEDEVEKFAEDEEDGEEYEEVEEIVIEDEDNNYRGWKPRKSPEIKVVLNGGTSALDSATIPMRVFLSDEVLEQKPTHMLVVDWTDLDLEYSGYGEEKVYSDNLGSRNFYSLKDGLHFLQLQKAGNHRFGVAVFKLEEDFSMNGYLATRSERYTRPLSVQDFENFQLTWVLASCVIDFSVPDEVFAKRSETKFGKLVWDYVNLWHKEDPRDQCEYRRRKILGIPKFPVALFVGVSTLLCVLVVGFFGTLYILLGSLLVLLFGWRPVSVIGLFKEFLGFFSEDRTLVLRKYPYDRLLWSQYNEKTGKYEPKHIGFAPIAIVPALVSFCLLVFIEDSSVSLILWNLFIIIVTALYVVIKSRSRSATALRNKLSCWIVYLNPAKMEERHESRLEAGRKARQEYKERADAKYSAWLKGNLALENKVEKVAVADAPEVFGSWGRRKKGEVRIKFWATKAKVCKPFQKR